MRKLRLKFVEQAKKYLGIPYARKYFEPGSKLFVSHFDQITIYL